MRLHAHYHTMGERHVGLRPTHCISDFMRELKKSSSIWVHETIGQREHQGVKTFLEEYIEFLDKAGVQYERKYLD